MGNQVINFLLDFWWTRQRLNFRLDKSLCPGVLSQQGCSKVCWCYPLSFSYQLEVESAWTSHSSWTGFSAEYLQFRSFCQWNRRKHKGCFLPTSIGSECRFRVDWQPEKNGFGRELAGVAEPLFNMGHHSSQRKFCCPITWSGVRLRTWDLGMHSQTWWDTSHEIWEHPQIPRFPDQLVSWQHKILSFSRSVHWCVLHRSSFQTKTWQRLMQLQHDH